MNTNLIMGLLIQLVAALKEPPPPASGSYSNLWITQPRAWNQIYTNGWGTNLWTLRYTNSLIDWGSGVVIVERTNQTVTATDEAIRELAKSGRICEVLGHRWEGGRVGEGPLNTFADFHPGVTFRHCTICPSAQTKAEGDWK